MKRLLCFMLLGIIMQSCDLWVIDKDVPCSDFYSTDHYILRYNIPQGISVMGAECDDNIFRIGLAVEGTEVSKDSEVLKYSSFYGDTLYDGRRNDCFELEGGGCPMACVSPLSSFQLMCNDSVVSKLGKCEIEYYSYESTTQQDKKVYSTKHQKRDVANLNMEQSLVSSPFVLNIPLGNYEQDFLVFTFNMLFQDDPITGNAVDVPSRVFLVDKANRKWTYSSLSEYNGEEIETWYSY